MDQEVAEVEEAPANQCVHPSSTVQKQVVRSLALNRNTNVSKQRLELLLKMLSFPMPRKSQEGGEEEGAVGEEEGEEGVEAKGTAVAWFQVDWTGPQLRGLNRR